MFMDKVFVVVSHYSDSNTHESSSEIVLATCKRSTADKVVSTYKKYSVNSFEIVETELYD